VNVFGIGLPEMALIFILALLIFGPKKLPEIGRSLGKAIRGFQDASNEFQSEFKREAEQIEKAIKEPMEAKLEESPQPILSPANDSDAEAPLVEAQPVASEPTTTAES
jgi:sec-independent protein translocase protein TatA